MSAVTLENVTLAYHRHPAVHHVSGQFRQGVTTAIVGPNGAGKSSLLKALVGLLPVQHGSIRFADPTRHMAYLPQLANIDRSFPVSVRDVVLLGHWRKRGWFGGMSQAEREQVEQALATVGLEGFGDRSIGSLSSGQFQRVLFSRILLQDAPIILLDEPFTGVDARTTADLLRLIQHWQHEGRTVIGVLHDFDQVRSHFMDTVLLAKECIAWGPTQEVLTPAYLQRANGMAERWVDDAPVCHRDDPVNQSVAA